MLNLVIFGFVVQQAAAVINTLTPLEYDKLPKLIHIDEYSPCMRVPGDIYCQVSANLYGNMSDPLYYTMVEYSKNVIMHFNHTKLYWGICPKKSCHQHMNVSSNLTEVLEACLNDTLTRDYRLTAKVYKTLCDEYNVQLPWDASDYAFGAVLLALLGVNVLGSLYDFFSDHGRESFVGRFLLCFAVRRNWARLIAPPSSKPMFRRIRVLNSFKTITAFLVILGHSPIALFSTSNNPQVVEETYHNVLYHLLYNGTLVVQIFFTIAGTLLAYNILLLEEKRPSSWQSLPTFVLLRWLRLTPVYALVLFYVMTWARHIGAGPFFQMFVMTDAIDCRRDWWLHLLYIHNYKDSSQCMAHSWYLAADFQLFVIGLLVFHLLYSSRSRKIGIGLVIFVGLLTPALHTYIQDLHAVLIVAPEVVLNFFIEDPTFNNLYKRGHTNLVCYGLGMALAYMVYNLKESDIGAEKFKKYRILYWLLFPMIMLLVLLGSVFYIDDIVIPIGVRVVYSSVIKFIFGIISLLFMFFTIVKVDGTFRGFLHWGGWALISRVTYLAYLVHVPIMRFTLGNYDELIPAGPYWCFQNYFALLCISLLTAVILFILAEAPLAEVMKIIMLPAPQPEPNPVSMEDITKSKENIEVKQ